MSVARRHAPVTIGVLADHPAAGGARFLRVVRRAFSAARALGRLCFDLDLVEEQAEGLPAGSTAAVEAAFGRLAARGVGAIIGPAITDNALVVRELADAAEVPCINWTGGEQTRSEWMFQYQVGSLEEEPAFLAAHLATRGLRSVVVVADDSVVASRCLDFFVEAAEPNGLEIVRQMMFTREGARDLLRGALHKARADEPDALVYLGLWALAREVALELAALEWRPHVFSNSALMFGHARPEWCTGWDGWQYVDAYSDWNPLLRQLLRDLGTRARLPAVTAAAAWDMGRLLAEGVARAPEPTRAGIRLGLERVKLLPAALGASGTTMSFGPWERAALKGRYLVLREWRNGASVEIEGALRPLAAPR